MPAEQKKRRLPRGRPCLLTPEVQHAITQSLGVGTPFKYACEAQGVSEGTGLGWMRWGEEGKKPAINRNRLTGEEVISDFVGFLEAVTRARAQAVENLQVRALSDGPLGARWMLERRYPKEYGARQRIDHTVFGGGEEAESEDDLARRITAWKRAVLADDLPSGSDRLGDSSAQPATAGASATPPLDAPLPGCSSEGQDRAADDPHATGAREEHLR